MRLPPELRLKVYEYHLILPTHKLCVCRVGKQGGAFWFKRDGTTVNGPSFNRVTSLLCVSQIVCKEAMPIYYRFHEFDLSHDWSPSTLYDFLASIGPERRKHVREISFKYQITNAPAAFHLLASAENLTKLHIRLTGGSLTGQVWGKRSILKAHGLKHLLKIRGLETLELEFDHSLPDSILAEDREFESMLQVLKQPKATEAEKQAVKKDKAVRTVFGKANVITRSEQKMLDSQQT